MTVKELIESLQDPPREFRPVSFWFLNHFLEEDELRRQIVEQDEKGFGGVMCHARDGLRTAYLEAEWEDAMHVILDECEKRGMIVWLYDENHYPSGIAGGKIPKRFPGRTMLSLVPVVEREVGEGEVFSVQCSVFSSDNDSGGRFECPRSPLSSPLSSTDPKCLIATGMNTGRTVDLLPLVGNGLINWTNDLGEPAFVLGMVESGYETNPVNHPDFSFYPDYLDEELCRGFIEETHEWYAKRFGDAFGSTIKGIFTDNACAHFGHIRRCVPWSRELGKRLTAATGIAFTEVLAKLLHPLPGHREARLLFWRFFGDEFIRVFVGAINEWCKAHGLYSTGHYCLEDGMGEHVRQIGSYFEVMKNMNFTGVDQICTRSPQESLWGIEGGEPLTACIRNTASAALFYDSPQVLCESFGCCSGWSFDLRETRRIGGHLAALGVDLFVPHGLYYSIAGTRKYECTPDHLHHPMWKYYRAWSDPASRLAMLTSGSDSLAEVAVLYPVTTLQATVGLGTSDAGPCFDLGSEAVQVRDIYDGLLDALSQNHVSYEIMAEDILHTGSVDDTGRLAVPTRGGRSTCRFSTMLLPGIQVLETESLKRLQAFARGGGTVLCLGTLPGEVFDPATGTLSPLGPDFLEGRAVLLGAGATPAEVVHAACAWVTEHLPQPIAVAGADAALASRAFGKDSLRYYLLHNSTDEPLAEADVTLCDSEEPVCLDLDEPTLGRIAWERQEEAWRAAMTFAPGQSRLFVCGLQDTDAIAMESPVETGGTCLPEEGPWTFTTDRDNILMLRHSTVEQKRSRQISTFRFTVEEVPSRCRLLLDLEKTLPELHAGRTCNRLQVLLNGTELPAPEPGTYLDRYIEEVECAGALCKGENELIIAVAGSVREDGHRLWPPMLVGDFTVWRDADGDRIAAPVRELALGDWVAQGFPDFAGEGRYRKTIQIPAGALAMLDLGDLANACEVWVDGEYLGRRIAPPWRFTVPAAPHAERDIEIRVTNTPNNLFETVPHRAGLFGPVCVGTCNTHTQTQESSE